MSEINEKKQAFNFEGFLSLDDNDNADYLIESMAVMYNLASVKKVKENAIKNLAPLPNDTILEVGCGHGFDAATISDKTENLAEIFAIDSSHKMIELAKKLNSRPNLYYITKSLFEAEFKTNSFSKIYADRFLVGHKDKLTILEHLYKLLINSGKIVISDVDAHSIIFYPFDDIAHLFLEHLHSCFINPFMGRELHALMIEVGFKNVVVEQHISMIQDVEIFNKIFDLDNCLTEMISKNWLTEQNAKSWRQKLYDYNSNGKFLYSVNMFTVTASK